MTVIVVAVLVILVLAFVAWFMRKHRPVTVPKVRQKDEDLHRLQAISTAAALSLYVRPAELLETGDMYLAGVYPEFAGDKDVARALYMRAAVHPATRGVAMAKLEAVKHTHPDVRPQGAPPLPAVYAAPILDARPAAPTVAVNVPIRPATNLQSVHDHSVLSCVKKTLKGMATTTTTSYKDVANEIRQHALDGWADGDPTAKDNVLHVLDAIMNSDESDVLQSVECSEKDAMRAVWGTISAQTDTQLRQNVKDTLVASLADAVISDGLPVCPTGRVVKLVSSLDGTGVSASTTTTTIDLYTVKQELMNLASKTRDKHDAETNENVLKEAFRTEAERVYVGELGMAKDVLGPMVNEIEQGF